MNGGVQLSLGPGRPRPKPLFPAHIIAELESAPGVPTVEDGAELLERLEALWLRERETIVTANEAQTEDRWIQPIMEALGFSWIVRPAAELGGRAVELDMALYGDDDRRLAAEALSGAARFEGAWSILEAKRFERDLDARRAAGSRSEDPVAQTIQYLAATGVRWAVLTNGRLWRLYGAEGDLVEGACHETDLVAAVGGRDVEAIRRFLLLFGRDAYVPGHDGRCRLDALLEQSLSREVEVGEALERQVYRAVPLLAEGLLSDDEPDDENLGSAFENALVLLFRLLFCLHAEDRGLLPVDNVHYRHYSVRERRGRIAADIDASRRFSGRSDDLFNDLRGLFSIVNRGDPDLGVNEYDGGLFDNSARPWLEERAIPDSLLAPALDCMFRVGGHQVDYADLSVRHLGTIYEQLLAYRLVRTDDGFELQPSDERHDTGSYFTPEFVVDEIIEQTLGPLLGRLSSEIAAAGLQGEAALEAFLAVKVLDPAMGSGHFLISAAAFIAQHIANDPSYADGEHARDDLMRLAAEQGRLLLFPYERDANGEVSLVPRSRLEQMPRTASYFEEHEATLSGRERGRWRERDDWWEFGRNQGLRQQADSKLGVPRLCERLRAAADLNGGIHLDNVDVNGILPAADGTPLAALAAVLNARALDWAFRRHSVPFRGAFFSANKQFIAHLPIPIEGHASLDSLGQDLIATATAIADERSGFLSWLRDSLGAALTGLAGITTIRAFADVTFQEFLAALQQNDSRCPSDLRSRAFVDALRTEWTSATARIADHRTTLTALEDQADALVYDLFELTGDQRALINAEYPS